jgi:hypothetical protein
MKKEKKKENERKKGKLQEKQCEVDEYTCA